MNYKVRFVDYPLHYHRLESEIDAAIKEVLSLPPNTEVSNEQVEFVIESIRKFYKRKCGNVV